MPFLKNLLLNRNFILITSVVLGLTAGRFASLTQPLILPVMALVMTLSTASVTTRDLKSLKTNPGPILVSLVLGSFVTSGIIILLANWLIDDREMWTGFILIAAVPPAVAVVPYTFILGGDMCLSLLGMVAGYLAALVLTPAIIVLFLGVDSFNPVQLVVMLLELIVIPLVASRILLVTGINSRIEKWRGTIINWSFFIVLFTIIGLNRQVFFQQFDVLVRIAIIAVAITFILGHVIELFSRLLHVKLPTTISLILLATMKNYGLAGAIALTLFSPRASVPGSVCIIFAVFRMIWFIFHFRKRT